MSDRRSMSSAFASGSRTPRDDEERPGDDAEWTRFTEGEGWEYNRERQLAYHPNRGVQSLDALPPDILRMITPVPAERLRPRNMVDLTNEFKRICATNIKLRLREILEEKLAQRAKDTVRAWDKLADRIIEEGCQWLRTRPFDKSSFKASVSDLNAISQAVHYFMECQFLRLEADFEVVKKRQDARYANIEQGNILLQVLDVTTTYVDKETANPTRTTEAERRFRNLSHFNMLVTEIVDKDLTDAAPYKGPLQ